MTKNQYINLLQDGTDLDDLFAISFLKPSRPYVNGHMFEVRVGDRSGQMMVKYWGGRDEATVHRIYQSLSDGAVVRIKGRVRTGRNNDTLEIHINPDQGHFIKPVLKEQYDLIDFVPVTSKDIGAMFIELLAWMSKVKDPALHAVLDHFFLDPQLAERFRSSPAAITHHCNYVGGLLEHTLNVTRICQVLFDVYPDLDQDLLITGALLHDIGKIEEYQVGTSIDATVRGRLVGHVVMGAEMVEKVCEREEALPEQTRWKLVHMVLSSHGDMNYGSPKMPAFPEALALSLADHADAKLDLMVRAKLEARTDDDWMYHKELGNIFLR